MNIKVGKYTLSDILSTKKKLIVDIQLENTKAKKLAK